MVGVLTHSFEVLMRSVCVYVSVPPCVPPQPGGEQKPHPLCQQCPEGNGTVSIPQNISWSRDIGSIGGWWRAEVPRQRWGMGIGMGSAQPRLGVVKGTWSPPCSAAQTW